jgi:hypothetical protein
MNTWNDIEHGFGPARATQYTVSDTDQLAATLYKLFHGRYVKSDNGHVITLSDGTHLTITLGGDTAGVTAHTTSANDSNQDAGIQPMRAKADRRIIERAHLHTNVGHAGTITSLALILFYQGETIPATIRTGYANITTGTFATPRDKNKPLATIRVALTQTQINEWVNREQQALADMLVGETIVAATNGVLTLTGGTLADEGTGALAGAVASADQSESTGDADSNRTVTIHATLNNHKRGNTGTEGGHATTITLSTGQTLGPITHAWVTHTRAQDTREQPGYALAPQPMIEQAAAGENESAGVNATADSATRRNRRETTVITLHATTPDNPTPIALYTSVYSGRTAHHGLTIEHSDGRVVNGEAAATHTTIRLPHK